MDALEVVRPLLRRASTIIKSHIRDVEFAVIGVVSPDGPLLGGGSGENIPPKKQQVQTCSLVCVKWGSFPLVESELEKMISNWSLLPDSLRIPALVELITTAQDDILGEESSKSNTNSELVQAVFDVLIVEWLDACIDKVDHAALVTAIEEKSLANVHLPSSMQQHPQSSSSLMVKLLSRRLDSNTPASAWWWSGIILKLRALASLRWTKMLRKLSGREADDFILQRLTPLGTSAGGSSGAAMIAWCASELSTKDLANSHLPALLLQSYLNADDDVVREVVLESLRVVIERADLESTPDAARVASKAIVLAEGALKVRDVKDAALKVIAALLSKTLGDNYELMYDKFIAKRVVRALSGTDPKKASRAVDLANIILRNALRMPAQKKLAALLSAEIFEKAKPSKALKGGSWTMEDSQYARLAYYICLADPVVGITRTLPSLLFSEEEYGSRKNVIGICALCLVLNSSAVQQMEMVHVDKFLELVQRYVVPCLVTLASSSSSPSSSQTYDWTMFTEALNNRRSLVTNSHFFGSLVAQSSQAELKAKWFLRKQHEEEVENAFASADRLLQSYVVQNHTQPTNADLTQAGSTAVETVLDPVTETRIMCILQGIECLLVARKLSATAKSNRLIQLPPVQFLDRTAHHPAVRSTCFSALKRVASSPVFMDKTSVLKALRDQVADTMDFVTELVACVRVEHSRHPRPPSPEVVKDIGASLDALALALATAGLRGSEELALATTWMGLSPNRLAEVMRKERNIVRLVFEMPASVQQEVIRLIAGWTGMQRKSREVSWTLATRGMSVTLACDPAKANLEDVCWNPNVKRTNNSGMANGLYSSFTDVSLLLDVVVAAEYQEKSAVAVLTRIMQWWKSALQASTFNASSPALPSSSSFSTSRKFSVLRRLTSSASSSSQQGSQAYFVPGSSISSSSGGSAMGLPQPMGVGSEELGSNEEDEIFVRVVRRVIDSRTTLRNSLKANGNASQVAKLLKEVISIFSSALTNVAQSGGKRRSVSLKFAVDLCAIVCIFCEELKVWMTEEEDVSAMPYSQACKVADDAWGRAERRKLWILLRRFAGISDVPIVTSPNSSAEESASAFQEKVLRAATALLHLGPVSLGAMADAPDKEMWGWILRVQSIADGYLRAHFISLLPSYFTRAFPPVITTSTTTAGGGDKSIMPFPNNNRNLAPSSSSSSYSKRTGELVLTAVLRAVQFHFGMDFALGVAPGAVIGDRIPRALLLALVLLCPNEWLNDRPSDVANLLCAAIVSRVEDCEGHFRELNLMMERYKQCDLEQTRMNIAKVAARVCPDLCDHVTELLWERRAFALSEPFTAKAQSSNSLFERALAFRVPGQVWKMFLDEQAAMRFLVKKASENQEAEEDTSSTLQSQQISKTTEEELTYLSTALKHVARKSAFGNLIAVLLPLIDPDPTSSLTSLVRLNHSMMVAAYSAVVEKASELFAYCAMEDADAFTRLAIVALASSESVLKTETLVKELSKFLRLLCGLDRDVNVRQHADWVKQQLSFREEDYGGGGGDDDSYRPFDSFATTGRKKMNESLYATPSSSSFGVKERITTTNKESKGDDDDDDIETFILVALHRVNETLCQTMLDEVLVRLAKSTGVHRFAVSKSHAYIAADRHERQKEAVMQQQTMMSLMRLYCKLRLTGVSPRKVFASNPKEETLVLVSCGPQGLLCLQVLSRVAGNLMEFGFDIVLRMALEYLAECWSSGSRSNKDDAELLVIGLFERRLKVEMVSDKENNSNEDDVKRLSHLQGNVPQENSSMKTLTERVFWAGMERLLRLALIAGMPSLSDTQRTDCFRVLKLLAGEDAAMHLALNLLKNDAMLMVHDCGEEALLVLFDVARETESEDWIVAALKSKSAGVLMAARALSDVLCNPRFNSSARLAQAAAALVAKANDDSSPMRFFGKTTQRYRGLVDEDEAMIAADMVWNGSGIARFVKSIEHDLQLITSSPPSTNQAQQSQQQSGSQKRRSFLNVKKRSARMAEVGEGSASSGPRVSFGNSSGNVFSLSGGGSDLQQSHQRSSGSSPGLKRPVRKPLVDIREALSDPYARSRLLAHVADRRLDPSLVLALEHHPHVPGIDRDDLWQSFQRSRWWLFEDDVSSLFT